MFNNRDLRVLSGLTLFFDFAGRYLILSCFGLLLKSSLILFAATLMVSVAFWYSLTCFFPVDLIWYSLIFVSGLFLSSNRFNLAKPGNFGPFRCKTGQGIKRFPKYSPIWPISCSDCALKTASVSHSELWSTICPLAWIFGFLAVDVSSTADDVSMLTSPVGSFGTVVTSSCWRHQSDVAVRRGDMCRAQAGWGDVEAMWQGEVALLLCEGRAVFPVHRTTFGTEVVSVRGGPMQWEAATCPGVRR